MNWPQTSCPFFGEWLILFAVVRLLVNHLIVLFALNTFCAFRLYQKTQVVLATPLANVPVGTKPVQGNQIVNEQSL